MLKILVVYGRDTSLAKLTHISRQDSPCFTTWYLLIFAKELWWIDQELLELRWGLNRSGNGRSGWNVAVTSILKPVYLSDTM
jgi:hypothetical protein